MKIMIRAHIQWFLQLHGLYPDIMSGFRSGRSPLDNIIDLTTLVEQYRAKRCFTTVVFLDVEGVFDSTCNDAILSALEQNGLRVESFVWFAAALQKNQYLFLF